MTERTEYTCPHCGYRAPDMHFQSGCPACCDGDPNGIPTVFHEPLLTDPEPDRGSGGGDA